MRIVKQAKVPSSRASVIIPELISSGLVDRSAKISKHGEFRLIPLVEGVEDEVAGMGFDIVEGEAYTMERRPPQERILEELKDLGDLAHLLPMKWEYVGDIIILKLDPSLDPYRKRIGEAYAKVLGVATVCADDHGVSGEFRRPSMELLYGTDTESIRLENGIEYSFDVTKVMFASGNTDERQRMKSLHCEGETVVDMFAGIGYFTLPLAKFARPRRLFACEKNPDSYEFLVRNIKINGLEDTIIPILGDNRSLLGERFADRILMGYVQTTSDFLPKALGMIKKGGIIHYHDTFGVDEKEARIKEIFDSASGPGTYEIEYLHEVKSFAPAVSHYVADVRILE